MRKSLPIFITLFFIATMSVAAMPADNAPATAASTNSSSSAGVVNINTADVAQLSMLPRIGGKVAQRIVDYRTEHGPFAKTSDLMQVKGIGDKSFQNLSSYLTVSGKTTLTAKVRSPKSGKRSKSQQPTPAAQ
jgi:competence ComEA-like helix-hairpin-helix protein